MNKIIAGAVAAIAFAGAANATQLTYNVTFPVGTTTNPTNQKTDFSDSGSFQLFDSSLGTLTSVQIFTTYSLNTDIKVTSIADAGDVTVNSVSTNSSIGGTSTANSALANFLTTNYDTAGSGTKAGKTIYYNETVSASPLATGQTATVADGSTVDLGSASNTGTTTAVFNSSNYDLSAFTGSANSFATFIAQSLTGTSLTYTGGNAYAQQTTTGTASFQVTYNYDVATAAVPEPATWAMMLVGFGFVGYGIRRRGTSVAFS